jgi:NADP-dependent 3-hydroxy acid dehydrogenase YdfG
MLNGKIVVITGATSGIEKETADISKKYLEL